MTNSLNSYFIPGFGISRTVIQSEIRYHCGPDAIVRPYTLQGRDGFLVCTPGPPLTKAQIQDIKDASEEYESKQAERLGDAASGFVNQPVSLDGRKRRSN